MAVTDAFLGSCRTEVEASAEYTAFRAAALAFGSASRAQKAAKWVLAYSDMQAGLSPAYRLRAKIREIVNARTDAPASQADREAAYRTLVAQYAPKVDRPAEPADELAKLNALIDLSKTA